MVPGHGAVLGCGVGVAFGDGLGLGVGCRRSMTFSLPVPTAHGVEALDPSADVSSDPA